DLAGGISGRGYDQERAWGNVRTGDFTSHDKVTFGSFSDPADSSVQYTPATSTCPDGTSRTGGLEINFIATGNYLTNGGAGSFTGHFEIVGSSGGLDGTT